jgi:hypothetical protein
MRFRELTPVNFSQVRILKYFWAVQLEPPTRMSDLYKCLKSDESGAVHRDKGQAFKYEFEADEVVYVPRKILEKVIKDSTNAT